jgi:hypothetical protein
VNIVISTYSETEWNVSFILHHHCSARGWKFKSSSEKHVFYTAKVFTLQEVGITLQGNANEMSLYFSMLSSYTIDDAGAKSVVIKASGCEKIRVTTVLTELGNHM